MTAADITALAAAVSALAVVGATLTWIARTSKLAIRWRRRRQRDQVLGYVIPACMVTLMVAAFLFQSRDGDSR